MSDESATDGIRYLDFTTLTSAIVVTSAVLMNPDGRVGTGTRIRELLMFLAVCACFGFIRRRLYARRKRWVIAGFWAFLCTTVLWASWRLPFAWFIVVGSAGSLVLFVGLVAPFKPMREPPTRKDVFPAVTVFGTCILLLAMGEAFLRLMPGIFDEETRQLLASTPGNSGVGHSYVGHLHRPDRTILAAGKDFRAAHNVDALGFRNSWPWPERADILAVGDSLTFGLCVGDDQAWPALVARSSHKRVINLGLVGASPEQYFRVYETFGVKLQPKVLLVGVYAQNDFWDAGMFDLWLQHGSGDNYMVWRNFGRPLRSPSGLRDPAATAESLLRSRIYPLVRSSHLYNLVRAVTGGAGAESAAAKTIVFADGGRLQLDRNAFLTNTSGAQQGKTEFRLVVDAFRRLHRLATSEGAHVLLILQPGKEEVYLPLTGESVPDPSGPLREALEDAGIEYLDLAPVFRERAAAGARLFFEVDSHPNEAGYALIAQTVASHINSNAAAYGLND